LHSLLVSKSLYLTIVVSPPFMKKFIVFLPIVLLFAACSPKVYVADKLTYKGYPIRQGAKKDPALIKMLQPYSDSVNNSMNGIIGTTSTALDKGGVNGSLGIFITDAMLSAATKQYIRNVDGAFVNNGGIRLTQITAGPITTGKIFELMPFDNLLILQEMTGTQLQEFLDHISARGGFPTAGITYGIQNKKAVNVMVKGKPINMATTYTIANSDYIANGGDDCTMLKILPQISNGYLIRDALIDYLKEQTAEGKTIKAKTEERVKRME
jgi:2',3'-cyclic-nucleotide 2'-phosphodiesterase (5'-nucleotidase family)